jgi:hypothetical protein
LSGTYQRLVYANNVNLLGESINTVKKNTETFLAAVKEIDVEVNAEKTKYMFISCEQSGA